MVLIAALNDTPGGDQDGVGTAVASFESKKKGMGIIFFEGVDKPDIGAPKPVNGLVGIADNAEIGVIPGGHQYPDQLVLGQVDVLVLVHKEPAEFLSIVLSQSGIFRKKKDGEINKVL
ncbi:MAG: hypothetical protein MIO92_04715, partial [Methanosarcinaceae archaeon]|nr:hypothetical protein [Methanosarcinaceae archaeon]